MGPTLAGIVLIMALTNVGWAVNSLFGLLPGVLADVSSERASLFGLSVVIVAASLLLGAWRARDARLPVLAEQAA